MVTGRYVEYVVDGVEYGANVFDASSLDWWSSQISQYLIHEYLRSGLVLYLMYIGLLSSIRCNGELGCVVNDDGFLVFETDHVMGGGRKVYLYCALRGGITLDEDEVLLDHLESIVEANGRSAVMIGEQYEGEEFVVGLFELSGE